MEVNGVQSEMLLVRSGVPQGSIIGPLLFIVYANDIPLLSSFSVYLYADDTELIKSVNSFEGCSHLQERPDALYSWCQHWKLTMNLSECCVLHTSHSCSFLPSSYTIGGKPLRENHSKKDLGVLVNSNLSWSAHIVAICGKAYYQLNLIRISIIITFTINVEKLLFIFLVR